jgi:hypothetical protein
MKNSSPRLPHPGRPGIAIVVVVSMMALLALLVVAFLLLSSTNRTSSNNDASGRQAQSIAKAASQMIVSDLVAEMRAGSTVIAGGSGGAPKEIFRVDNPKKMLPERSTKVTAPTWGGTTWSNSETLSLIKQSANGKASYTGGTVRASNVNTASKSVDGRSLAASFWSKPRLFPPGYDIPIASTPDWVYLTRSGGNPTAFTAANKTSLAGGGAPEPAYVVGRYAWQIHDVGGLLDMNAAGFNPSGTPAATIGGKGSLLLADLRAIPGLTSDTTISDVVTWRNKGSWSDLTGLLQFGRRYGWLRPYTNATRTDNLFLSRSDLIRFLEDKAGESNAHLALPYLTSFTRTLDRPSFQPSPTRPKIIYDATQGGSNAKGLDDSVNPGARNATDGALLAKQRFALENIELLQNPAANSARIEQLFGLTRSGNRWAYQHGRPDDIVPIGSPDMGSRKGSPDFFETLKAAIHAGSLGVQHGSDNAELQSGLSSSGLAGSYAHRMGGIDSDINYQILKIGANIIDQWDADSYPTVIEFNGEIISGNESLPYINAMMNYLYAEQRLTVPVPIGFRWESPWTGPIKFVNLMTPRLWNPYVSANADPGQTPTEFRVSAQYVGADTVSVTRHDGNNEWFMNPSHLWHNGRGDAGSSGAFRWNYAPIGGENYGPGENANPASELDGCRVDFSLPGNWTSSWPYVFSDPRMLYRTNYPTTGVTLSAGAGPVRFSSIQPQAKDGFNEEGKSYSSFVAPYDVFGFPLGRGWQGPHAKVIDDAPNNHVADIPPAQIPSGQAGDDEKTSFSCVADRPVGGLLKLTLSCKSGSDWLPYDVSYVGTSGKDGYVHNTAGTPNSVLDTIIKQQTDSWIRLDPRSVRGGMLWADTHPNIYHKENGDKSGFWGSREWREGRTMRFNAASGFVPDALIPNQVPAANQLWTIIQAAGSRTDTSGVFYNTPTSPYRYVDPDGVQRRGMGAYWTENSLDGQPMASSDPIGTFPFAVAGDPTVRSNRPVMLNRAFRSIAEMGVVFRDSPWRNLDFFTVESGDAALLDFFCLESTQDDAGKSLVPTSKEGSPVIAGRFNLNTSRQEVVSAAIRGVLRELNSTGSGDPFTTAADVDKVAQGLVNSVHQTTAGRPMRDPSELVGYPVSGTQYDGFAKTLGTLLSDAKDQKIQQRHEAVVRALADAGQASSWNVLIDLVAQSGKLTSGATGLNNFVVAGQKHYWVHLAIDRTSGEIIDQHWEPVYE